MNEAYESLVQIVQNYTWLFLRRFQPYAKSAGISINIFLCQYHLNLPKYSWI